MKSDPSQLAVLGGAPAFREPLHVGRPNVGDRARLMQRIAEALDRGRLTNDGPLVRELERRIASHVGARHCVATCNATVALQLLADAAGLRGEVVIPAFTFVATAHALRWRGITPVFCDADPGTHNLDPARVEELVTPRTSAIVGVHVWGRPCDVEALAEIARPRGLRLFFDAAHAFGNSHRGRMVGTLGEAEVLSFHATKFVNAFEGGAVVTDDDALAAAVRRMRSFGFADGEASASLGTNGKMHEVSAAMGLTSLDGMDEIVDANRRNYHEYLRALEGIPGVMVARFDEAERCNYQYVAVELDSAHAGIGRDRLVEVLAAENVFARRYFHPGVHRMEPYRSDGTGAALPLPVTEALCARMMTLPTGTAVEPADVRAVCAIIRVAVENASRLATRG